MFANYAEAFSMPDVGRVLRAINIPNQSVESFLDLEPILTENIELGLEYTSTRRRCAARLVPLRFGSGPAPAAWQRRHLHGAAREDEDRWLRVSRDVARHARPMRSGLRYAQTDGRFDSNADGRVDSDLGGANIAPGSHQRQLGSELVEHRELAPAGESSAGSRFRGQRRR